MKLPDFFYIKQTRALNNLHAFSVELLARLYAQANPVDAYSSEWGERQIGNFTAVIETSLDVLGKERLGRLLRGRTSVPRFSHLSELDRDVAKVEILQINIEQEMVDLFKKKVLLISLIATGSIMASLACELIKLSFP